VLEYVRELLSDDLFSDYKCIKAYQIIKQLEAEGKQPELVEIGMRLKAENINISEFYADTDSSTLTEQRIYVLKDLAIRRKLSALLFKGQTMVDDTTITIDDLQKLFGEFDDVLTQREGAESHSFGSVLTRLMNNVALRKENKGEQGIMTGLHIFDSRYGWHGGDLIIIAGETSQGKSTLATTICYNIAANDVPCLYLSLEMGEEQLVSRIIARSTQVSSSTTLYGRISDEEYNRLYDGSLKLKDLPIYFEEDSKSNFPKMRRKKHAAFSKKPIKIQKFLLLRISSSQDTMLRHFIASISINLCETMFCCKLLRA
jgi:replicative DNA helicase